MPKAAPKTPRTSLTFWAKIERESISLKVFNLILGVPLGYIIYFVYQLTGNYALALLLFTLLVKIILFPINIATHKNALRLLNLQPKLGVIKKRCAGDRNRLNEEQYNLFESEKYHPSFGLLPMFIQLFLVMGMIQVMYRPLQHLLHFDADVISAITTAANSLFETSVRNAEQLRALQAISNPANTGIFEAALSAFPNAETILAAARGVDLNFFGMNLGEVPSLKVFSIALLIPLFSGLSALVLCLIQGRISPGALGNGKGTNFGLTAVTVAFSLYFGFVMPAGVGLYWLTGNLLGIAVLYVLNAIYSPKKLAGDALAYISANRKTPAQLKEEKRLKKELSAREKVDGARFLAAKKQLVFYALTAGQYKYYKCIIEYLLEHSDITVHYLTGDPDDAVFKMDHPRFKVYYAGQQKTIFLMLRLDTDICVTTVPDLQSFHMKRSVVRDDIEYIYTFHALCSSPATAREEAFDHFNTMFLVGPHRIADLRRRESITGLPAKKMVKTGYGLYDQLVKAYEEMPKSERERPRILIAPSWQADNILELCIDDMLDSLVGNGYEIIVRPHPQFSQLFPERVKALTDRYQPYLDSGEIIFELDFADSRSIYQSDILMTDWSNIAFEFSYCTRKPCIFINTPMKVLNPNYERVGKELLHVSLRDRIGVSVDLEKIKELGNITADMLSKKYLYREEIAQVVKDYVYYPGRSGEAGGKYIMNQIKLKNS